MTTTLDDLYADLWACQASHTRTEHHGAGELTLHDERPVRASGCILPDGTTTDAECLVSGLVGDLDGQPVWTRRLAGTPLRRRGRLAIEPGVALRFVDEPSADVSADDALSRLDVPNLERDLNASERIRAMVRSDLFATLLYGALCNTTWRHVGTDVDWSCSWRLSGDIVAMLRAEGSYMDWYCSGGEDFVDEQVLAEIRGLGWELMAPGPTVE